MESVRDSFSIISEHLTLNHQNFPILFIGEQKIIIKTSYETPHLYFEIIAQIEGKKHGNELIISDKLIHYLSNLKQLRREWLLVNGLV